MFDKAINQISHYLVAFIDAVSQMISFIPDTAFFGFQVLFCCIYLPVIFLNDERRQ
jgi:hypothetical protein